MTEEEEFVWAVTGEGHLITNKAGASAKKQAKELREAEPVRTLLARVLRVHTDERAYRLGAIGEEEVGRRLAKLGNNEWLVLHDIIRNSSGTNVDHIVVGRPGVFSINTKNHPDAKIVVTERSFLVNGYAANYLHVARNEAKNVSKTLSAAMGSPIPVRAMIVVMRAFLDVRSSPLDVDVITRKDLPRWFLKRPATLDASFLRELMLVAGRPSTWKQASVVRTPPPTLPPPSAEQPLTVKKWNRGRLKRLYVNDALGTGLGYRDEVTGKIHATEAKDLERVTKALQDHPRAPN